MFNVLILAIGCIKMYDIKVFKAKWQCGNWWNQS